MSLKYSSRLFFFLFIFAPLAFGTVEPWSLAVMEIGSLSALVLYLFAVVTKKEKLYHVPAITPLILFLLFILLQLVPLPAWLVALLSPKAFSIHQLAIPLGQPLGWIPLSIFPKATLNEFFRYLSYAAFYILIVQLLTDNKRFKKTIIVITVFGALLAFSSILQFYLTDNRALWFRYAPLNSMIVGPYLCHNHYAGLMEMIFPVVLAFFFYYRPRFPTTSMVRGIVEIFAQEKANVHILIGGAAVLIVSSVFVSLSRGGMISLCLSLIFFTFLLFQRKISRGNTFLIIAVIVVSSLAIAWFGWDQIFERFAALKNGAGNVQNARLDFWRDSIGIIKDFSITGSGFGTFKEIYPAYKTTSWKITLFHAHNDYIELISNGGIIALTIGISFLFTIFIRTYKAFMTRRDAYAVYIYMGAVTGVVSLLLHGFTDFNLQIGANGLWFFFMIGLAVSASHTSLHPGKLRSRLGVYESTTVKMVVLSVTSFLLLCGTAYNCSTLIGNYYYSNIKNYETGPRTPKEELEKIAAISGHASFFDPLNSDYHFNLANAAYYLDNQDAAFFHFSKTISLNPSNSTFLNRFGLYLAEKGDNHRAKTLLKASVDYDITNPDHALDFGAWLLSQNEIKEGCRYLKQAVTLDHRLISKTLTTMAVLGMTEKEMESAVPLIPGPYITWASFLYSQGKRELADTKYFKALDFIDMQDKVNKNDFYQVYRFFMKRGKINKAMAVLERAETRLPMDADIKIRIGDLYKKQGIIYRARRKYEEALFIDPDNIRANRSLKKISGS